MRHSVGNTLTEYGLIGLLLLGICVTALSGLGNNLGTNLDHLQKSLLKKPENNGSTVGAVAGSIDRPGIPGSGSLANNGVNLGSLANGLSVTEMQETIQVSGANGATKELASKMAAYAQKLLTEGALTPEQANLLTRLANEGHKLANAEKLLEDAYAQNKNSIAYGGQSYTKQEFGELFGFNRLNGVVGSTKSMDDQMTNAKFMTVPFLTMYNQAKSRGALNDPAVAKVIDTLSTEITIASDLVKWNLEEAEKSGRSQADYQHRLGMGYVTALHQTNLFDSVSQMASEFTHGNSTQICSTGNAQDSGRQCAGSR